MSIGDKPYKALVLTDMQMPPILKVDKDGRLMTDIPTIELEEVVNGVKLIMETLNNLEVRLRRLEEKLDGYQP